MARLGFDSDKVADYNGVPAGSHNVRIVASEINPTKAGTGKILTLTMKVEDGPSKGMTHFERLNIINPNAMAQSISHRRLKDIMVACGLSGSLGDSEQLHNIPFSATFTVKEDNYGKKSDLKKVAPYGVPPTGQIGGQERGGAGANGSGQAMPWDS